MNPTFTETQKFNKWWHYLIAGVPVLLVTIIFALTFAGIIPPKNKESSTYLPLISTFTIGASIIFFIWFIFLKLKITIDETGINAHFKGMPFCNKKFTWNEIQTINVVEYSPLLDYGGWGVRYNFTGYGWCYNVSGNIGIKLTNLNGKPFLIGTQQKEEAEKIINHYFKK